jgi:hypothetical protein
MAESVRPKHVVIVDAENPLAEIQGEFYWREDHEQIVARERQSAYQAGYGEGWTAASQASAPLWMRVRRRPPLLIRILLRIFFWYCALAFGLLVIAFLIQELTPLI